ncbi:hypothetical protein WN55_08609 [Dufourea novaeangliae]|uniref:Transposable element Tc3 transposase n=1 Tax=Dufourea novaeangliae TaxID=178035 RepID=A0A154PT01_DUFNO|nr:hypothetical protein WN55_08609 [Dufourea novaeangliae]
MLLVYGECRRNIIRVIAMYAKIYPERNQTCRLIFGRLKVLSTDEATFTNRGQINLRNMHYWATENPPWMREVDHQCQWGINPGCCILGNQLIGSYFINELLTGQIYSNFLRDILPVFFLENVPLNIRTDIWYPHEACRAHYTHVARQVLDRQFHNRWIGRGGAFLWPPRSPDITPLDYYLWGTLKDMMYHEQQHQRI